MDLKRLKGCPYCGGTLTQKENTYVCDYCAQEFEEERAEVEAEEIMAFLDEEKQERLSNARRNLYDSAHDKHISTDKVIRYANAVKDIYPDDFFANFYIAALSNDQMEVNSFMDSMDLEENGCYAGEVVEFMLRSMESSNVISMKNLVERAFDGDKYVELTSRIEREAERLDEGVYSADIPRDVFVAYSSKDMDKVTEIVTMLEDEGISCFVALRNLRHGKGSVENYETLIKTAIDSCRIVVFVSTENSRNLSCDALKIELPYIRKSRSDMGRIEYVTEKYGPRTKFGAKAILEDVFAGLEYCRTKEDLVKRIIDMSSSLNNREKEEKYAMYTSLARKSSSYESLDEAKFNIAINELREIVPYKDTDMLISRFENSFQNNLRRIEDEKRKKEELKKREELRQKYIDMAEKSSSRDHFDENDFRKSIEGLKSVLSIEDASKIIPAYESKFQSTKKALEKEREAKKVEEERIKQELENKRIAKKKKTAIFLKKGIIALTVVSLVAAISVLVISVSNYFMSKDNHNKFQTKVPVYEKIDDTHVYFGNYPQTKVDATSENGLSSISFDKTVWTDYGYYIDGSVASYMYYLDVDSDKDGSCDYRGVYFTSYRPYSTTYSSSASYSYQDDNGYSTNAVYWFRYEPIKWTILESADEKALILADLIIDSQDYNYTYNSRTVDSKTVYANNYADSHVRKWLNDTFYETAFSDLERSIIQTTAVDNSASTSASGSNSYACADTSDRVFLLSYQEALKCFSTYADRQAKTTDYARCQGAYTNTSSSYYGFGYWWLRSPGEGNGNYACNVRYDGRLNYGSVNSADVGVRAACWINL